MDVNTIMTIFDLLLWGFLLYSFYVLFATYMKQQRLNSFLHGVEYASKGDGKEERVMIVRSDTVTDRENNSVVLLYDRDHNYLGQGLTEDEAIDNLRKYYPTQTFVIVEPDTKLSDPV
jgi:hypothetical protein